MLYYKLVRDKIPEIIEKSGKKASTYILSDQEYEIYLERKLDEEVQEYHESKNPEELADILEVLISLAKTKGYSFEELVKLKEQKASERGGFSKKILLLRVYEN